MLGIYLSSIIFWVILLYSLIIIFQEKIIENGWLKPVSNHVNPYLLLFCMSAVPILRVLFAVCIFLMAWYTEEEFNELANRDDD